MDHPPCCMVGELTSPADDQAEAVLRENSNTNREEILEATRDTSAAELFSISCSEGCLWGTATVDWHHFSR